MLVDLQGLRAFLTSDADHHLLTLDLSVAAANIRLDVIFGGDLVGTLDERIARQLESIQSARAKKIDNQAVLMLVATGKEDVAIGASLQKYPTFLTVQNGTQSSLFSRRYAEAVDSIKAAISLEIGTLDYLESIAEGVFFEWTDGRPLFSSTLNFSGRGTVAQSATADHALSVNRRFSAMRAAQTPRKAQRLIARMAEEPSDLLRQFVFGWTALEIFVDQLFAKYDLQFLESILDGGASTIAIRLTKYKQLKPIKEVSLLGRFIVVAALLSTTDSNADQEAVVDTFKKVQKARNDLLHRDDIREDALPIVDLRSLHRKLIGCDGAD